MLLIADIAEIDVTWRTENLHRNVGEQSLLFQNQTESTEND